MQWSIQQVSSHLRRTGVFQSVFTQVCRHTHNFTTGLPSHQNWKGQDWNRNILDNHEEFKKKKKSNKGNYRVKKKKTVHTRSSPLRHKFIANTKKTKTKKHTLNYSLPQTISPATPIPSPTHAHFFTASSCNTAGVLTGCRGFFPTHNHSQNNSELNSIAEFCFKVGLVIYIY